MRLWELFLIAVGLSADAFAVAICKGLTVKKIQIKHALTVGLYFGGFQAIMPLLGYYLGVNFQTLITDIDHWLAFILLAAIGINMIKESFSCAEELDSSFSFKSMLPMAIATSIDAMAIGITFAFLQVNIAPAVTFIGVITFVFSAIGLFIGNKFGCKFKSKAEIFGGIVLILIGLKIVLEHLGYIS